jgi:hypothetical protein
MLVYATRTFSNTLELLLTTLLIYLVACTMKRSDETVYLQAVLRIQKNWKAFAKSEGEKNLDFVRYRTVSVFKDTVIITLF